jgi:hypothetical protein
MLEVKRRKLDEETSAPVRLPVPARPERTKEELKPVLRPSEDVEFLLENDYVVLPVFTEDETPLLRRQMLEVIQAAPEFEDYSYMRVLGGFGAQATASSFHHPKARALRVQMAKRTREFARELAQATGHARVEELMDRLAIRLPGTSVSSEAAHRDCAPLGKEQMEDVIYGGWLNLEEEAQHFTGWPGSAVGYEQARVGFAQEKGSKKKEEDGETEKETPAQKKARVHAQLEEKYGKPQTIEIPSGHRIIFRQTILHLVHTSTVPKDKEDGALRLYQGLRLTDDTEPLFGRAYLDTTLEEQAAPLLPSGQTPRFCAKQHIQFHLPKATAMAEKMSVFLQHQPRPDAPIRPVDHMCAFKELKKVTGAKAIAVPLGDEEKKYSLVELGMEFKPWTAVEKKWFYPSQ